MAFSVWSRSAKQCKQIAVFLCTILVTMKIIPVEGRKAQLSVIQDWTSHTSSVTVSDLILLLCKADLSLHLRSPFILHPRGSPQAQAGSSQNFLFCCGRSQGLPASPSSPTPGNCHHLPRLLGFLFPSKTGSGRMAALPFCV